MLNLVNQELLDAIIEELCVTTFYGNDDEISHEINWKVQVANMLLTNVKRGDEY